MASKNLISIILVAIVVLIICSLSEGRMMPMPMPTATATAAKEDDASAMALKYFREEEEKLFFARLPKGVPIPPSAPSKRHNSIPQNR